MPFIDPLGYLGTPDATTTVKGKARLATISETTTGTRDDIVTTPAGVAAVAISGAPDASTTQKGIIEIATNGEAAAQSSGILALVPSNIPSIMASPGSIGGSTPSGGAFTTLSASGAFSLTGDTVDVDEGGTGASSLTDHGILLGSGTGAVSVTSVGTNNQLLIGQTGSDPVWTTNIDLPGTLDVTGAVVLDDALTVAGTATFNGSVVIDDITYNSNAITSSSSLDIDATDALSINSSGGVINIGNDAVAQNINVGTGAAARTITIGNVSGATGVVFNTGTGSFSVTTTGTGDITLDSDDTVLIDADGVLELNSSGGAISIGNDADSQSINIGTGAAARTLTLGNTTGATAVDIDIGGSGSFAVGDASAGALTFDTADGISLDAATASNFTVTGAGEDLTLSSVGGSVLVSSTEDTSLAIYLHANAGSSETIQIHSDQGTGVESINILSDVGGITLTATGLASDDAINLEAPAGGIDIDGALQVNITSSEDAADAIRINATNGGIDIDAGGEAGQDIVITNTGGSVEIEATEATADAIRINASNASGGIDLLTGGGELSISSSGNVSMVPATQSSGTSSLTINSRVGVATFTGFTTASAGTQQFTITNSALGAGDGVFVTVSNRGSNDAQMTLSRVDTETGGSLVIDTTNNGAAALNGDVIITFWIIN